jgi:hypothetical protein
MRGRTTSVLVVSFTFLSVLLLLGALASASSALSKMDETTTTATLTSPTVHATQNQTDVVTVSAIGTNGLRLSTSMNATELKVGQGLAVSVLLLNTLPRINVVKPSDDFAFNGVAVAMWDYCEGEPVQIDILQGNYSIQELPAATDVTFTVVCMEGGFIPSVVFAPHSDQVNLAGVAAYPLYGIPWFPLSLNFTTSGYYDLASISQHDTDPLITEPGPFSQKDTVSATSFAPGVYTLAVADEWGGYNILHFKVSPSPEG